MRKLFLLLLSIFMISAVSAEDYFVVVDGYSHDEIQAKLDSTSWDIYTPQITKVEGNTIYFTSEKDLARFLMPPKIINQRKILSPIFPKECMKPAGQYTLIYGYLDDDGGTSGSNQNTYYSVNTSELVKSYFLVDTNGYGSYGGGYGKFYIGSMELTDNYFGLESIPSGSSLHWQVVEHWDWDAHVIVACVLKGHYNGTFEGSHPESFYQYQFADGRACIEIYSEPGAEVYVDGTGVGTTDNGGFFKTYVSAGEHSLKISKDGFWDYTKTITIQNDTTLHISLAPKTSIFRVEKNMTSDLYPNSAGDVKLTLYPIRTAYGTQMTISGVDVVKVYYKNSLLAPSNGAYVLGTVDGPIDVEIQFKTPSSWGEHSFAVTISSSDIEGNSYTNQEQITYDVKELPFLLQTPNTWKIGDNIVTITDQSGEDSSVLLSLKTLDGKEIWSQSQGFNAYDSYDFTVPINQSGDYVLEILAKGGQVKTYVPVHVIDPIMLLTKEVNASKGSVATIKIEIQNPSNSVKYYDAQVIGEIFVNNTPKTTFSVAPNEDKIVELKFKVPENLTFNNYNLKVEVFGKEDAEPCFEGDVVLNIIASFLPFGAGGDSEIPLWAIAVVGILLIVGIGVYFLRRGD